MSAMSRSTLFLARLAGRPQLFSACSTISSLESTCYQGPAAATWVSRIWRNASSSLQVCGSWIPARGINADHTAKWMQNTDRESPGELINEAPPIEVDAPLAACRGEPKVEEGDEEHLLENVELLKEAEKAYEKALKEGKGGKVSIASLKEMLQELQESADPKDPRIAIIALRLGQEYETAGESPESFLSQGEQALKIFEASSPGFAAETAMCHHLMASSYQRLGQHEKSLASLNQALKIVDQNEGKDYDPVKFAIHFLLGDTLAALGKHEDALHHYCVGLAVQETLSERPHPQLATNYRQVGEAFTQVMLFDEAKALVEQALEMHRKVNGTGSVNEAIDRRLLAVIYSGLDEHEKALEEQNMVKKILKENNFGPEAVFVEIATADTQITLGRFDDAIASLRSAMSQLEDVSPIRALATVNLAKAYAQQGKMEEATSYCRAAIEFYDKIMEALAAEGPDNLAVGEGFTELAAIYERMNQPEDAIGLLKRALSVFEQVPQQLNAAAGAQAQIGMLLFFTGHVEEAIPYMEEAVMKLRKSFGDGHFSLALVLNHLGVAQVELDRLAQAVKLFEEAKAILTKTHGPGQHDTIAVYQNLVKVYSNLERYDEALACSIHIVTELEKQGDAVKELILEARKELEELQHRQSGNLCGG